jgi:hypothetical protein
MHICFSGELDHFYDPNFTADISQKMRVPKRIRVDGESDDDQNSTGSNWNTMLANEKFDMHVPDRILVVGKILLNLMEPNMKQQLLDWNIISAPVKQLMLRKCYCWITYQNE